MNRTEPKSLKLKARMQTSGCKKWAKRYRNRVTRRWLKRDTRSA